jgi:hypothetical protein
VTEERIIEIAKKHTLSNLYVTQAIINAIKEALAEEKGNTNTSIPWSTDDFMKYCEMKTGANNFYELTKEEAEECMQILKTESDTKKVNWDDIGKIIKGYKDAKGKRTQGEA